MPGRGRFWEVGALNDEIVEEADLTQALQTKVNAVGGGGSGNWEKVGDVTVSGGPVASQNVTLSRSVALDGTDVSMLVAVISTVLSAGDGIAYTYNNITAGGYTTSGNDLGTASYTNFLESGDKIFTDQGYNNGVFSILELVGFAGAGGNNAHGFIKEAGDSFGQATIGHFTVNTNVTAITSFQLKTDSGVARIADGTHIVIYAVTLN